ncbi:MAG: hypothetical protein ABIH34_06660 [Nanoarchaeota archaeon]
MKAVFTLNQPLLLEERRQDRSTIKHTKQSSVITVEAKDAVAFRAACNAILKQIVLLEKARAIAAERFKKTT